MTGAQEIAAALRTAFGDRLAAVAMYGSAARREQRVVGGDVNLLVIVEGTTLPASPVLTKALVKWVDAGNAPPLIFSRAEWQASADIFPMEHIDVLEGHTVLFGQMPEALAPVQLGHLRLQLEQEAMGKLLHLRRAALVVAPGSKDEQALLRSTSGALLVLLRATVRLHNLKPSVQSDEVARQASQLAGLDVAPFLALVSLRHAPEGGPVADSRTLMTAVLDQLQLLVSYINGFQHASGHYALSATMQREENH